MALAAFHPSVARWFAECVGEPTLPQVRGWEAIRRGEHTLIAAPTGSGKTLAAFLVALDGLLRQGDALADETTVLYVSPLRALSNDVRLNLERPLAALRERDPSLPEVRVLVRTGDTSAKDRAAMRRKAPHVLVTTPESLFILLASVSGRRMLRAVRTVIVDEIHALAPNRRGAHLALSLERLTALAGVRVQRVGLSATQRPIQEVAHFLGGTETRAPSESPSDTPAPRRVTVVDSGHLRHLDIAMELPGTPLAPVCSHEQWKEIHERIAALVGAHRTTLIFVNTRKLAERTAVRIAEIVGEGVVTAHHGSLSRERRQDAERRLKDGKLRALVATASLELGIDIGDVDLVVQIGATWSIATFLQRVGRAGHGVGRTPKGRLFPLTIEDLVYGAALLDAVSRRELDKLEIPRGGLDVLAQQIVASCVGGAQSRDVLFSMLRSAWPYRDLPRADFDACVALHTGGVAAVSDAAGSAALGASTPSRSARFALLHADDVNGTLRATRRAAIACATSGGAIPDNAQYEVRQEPEGIQIGHLDEDFAVESSVGDIVQLGTTSWRILKVEPGTIRVADAQGSPPTVPFWRGEAPSRTQELAAAAARVRRLALDAETAGGCGGNEVLPRSDAACGGNEVPPRSGTSTRSPLPGVPEGAWTQITDHVKAGVAVLGELPTTETIVAERFFDETGGMQLVIHAPFGGRVNRAWGLALRKRFCRGFGFELQAAATEDAILISLAPQHGFAVEDVFSFLHPNSARHVLEQAVLGSPLFLTRWRWDVTRALVVERFGKGRRVPAPLLRMRCDDALVAAFPAVLACPETLPGGDTEIPLHHPVVRQAMDDCLDEAMDVAGYVDVVRKLRAGEIRTRAVDVPEPSSFARSIMAAQPWAFLDDGAIEERRTQAVQTRRTLDPKAADTVGALDPAAIARVREEAWPDPRDAEEVHEALRWMGYVRDAEAGPWSAWLAELAAARRVVHETVAGDGRWYAAETSREPKSLLRGRLEALGPVFAADAALGADAAAHLAELGSEGFALRCRIDGKDAWCERRLLARIHRATIEGLRREIEPVTAAELLRFLATWQHATEERKLDGPRGVVEVVRQLAGFEIPAAAWEASVLPLRVRGYRREFLDQATLSGEVAWLRLSPGAATSRGAPIRTTPVALVPREDLDRWLGVAPPRPASDGVAEPPSSDASAVLDVLTARGASFPQEIERRAGLLPSQADRALGELVGRGLVTCDSFAGLRRLVVPAARRRPTIALPGRWSLVPRGAPEPVAPGGPEMSDAEFAARALLRRWGVVFKRVIDRERLGVPWFDIVRALRRMELRGDVRGGRFVGGFSGEQFALPDAVELLRRTRRETRDGTAPKHAPLDVSAADPLNLEGILTPAARVAKNARRRVAIG